MPSKVWQSNVKGNGARGGGAENGGESVMDGWRKGDGGEAGCARLHQV